MYRREWKERKGRASDFMKFSRRGHDMASVVNSGAWGGLAWPIPPSRTSNQVSINFHFLELQVSFFHCSFQGTQGSFLWFHSLYFLSTRGPFIPSNSTLLRTVPQVSISPMPPRRNGVRTRKWRGSSGFSGGGIFLAHWIVILVIL
jgi:hypothetical protein